MKRSNRFEPIVNLAEKREEDALRVFGRCQAMCRQLHAKAEALKQYRDDYTARFMLAGGHGFSAQQLLDYRSFLARLNQAICEQERRLQEGDAELRLRRREWEEAHSRTLSLKKVQASMLGEEIKLDERREQREADDRLANRSGACWSSDRPGRGAA